jgi:hypothetical protein
VCGALSSVRLGNDLVGKLGQQPVMQHRIVGDTAKIELACAIIAHDPLL